MIRMEVGTIQSFLDYFGKIRQRTMRVVACIPPDKIEWRAAPDKFTLGDLARHIAATERNVFVECACGGCNRYAGCGCELAEGRDEVVRFMERMHNESMNMLAQLSDDQLQRKCQSADGTPMTMGSTLKGGRNEGYDTNRDTDQTVRDTSAPEVIEKMVGTWGLEPQTSTVSR